MQHDWSVKHLVRTIVTSRTYLQTSAVRHDAASVDPENELLWRANRKRLSIEEIRDSLLDITGKLDHRLGGRSEPLWGEDATRRRAIYGFVNRFNLDPTLRAFDFPARVQTPPARGESIVATQALFLLNSPLVIEQASTLVKLGEFAAARTRRDRVQFLFNRILQRSASASEIERASVFLDEHVEKKEQVENDSSLGHGWQLLAQSLLASNEFQYID